MKQPEAAVLSSEGRRSGLCLLVGSGGMQCGSEPTVGMRTYRGAGAERESRSASASLGVLLLSQEGPARRKSGRHINNRM